MKLQRKVFSCEIYEIFNNIYFEEHLRTAASVSYPPPEIPLLYFKTGHKKQSK